MSLLSLILSAFVAAAPPGPCREIEHLGDAYTVCSVSPRDYEVAIRLRDTDGEPFGSIGALRRAGARFAFAMNGGMYRDDLEALGLYVEQGVETRPLIRGGGWGNFHLLPNGVFYVTEEDGEQAFGVRETNAFGDEPPEGLAYATQSGPMLVIDGALHPRFLPRSDSLKVRNGVGVTPDGHAHFAISHGRVRFHDFGTLFRDVIGAPNALFLDGTISTLEAGHRRRGGFRALGPIVTAAPRRRSEESGVE